MLAPKPAGMFYAVTTLCQMLTELPEFHAAVAVVGLVPCVRIEDHPRFAWRGMHLDVARHFFDKEFVKRYIDFLAAYKINVFHLYLTDDQGWRIEVKRYPRLTEVGAWRKGTKSHYTDGEGDEERYGGFFTQDDLREIVADAATSGSWKWCQASACPATARQRSPPTRSYRVQVARLKSGPTGASRRR